MSRLITVGIDGSRSSDLALQWAAAEAELHGFDLEIVHAVDVPMSKQVYATAAIDVDALAGLRKFSTDLVSAAERRAGELAPQVKSWGRAESGPPAAVLAEASETAYCIVVGNRGLGAFAGLVGSVSLKLAIRAKCPVIVVPERADSAAAIRQDGNIVVGVDESPYSVAAMQFALREAAVRKVSVEAVAAYEVPYMSAPLSGALIASLESTSRDHAAETVGQVIAKAQTAETKQVEIEQVLVHGPAAAAILNHAVDAPLIVVGSHGRGVVRRILLGSVSRELLHNTDRPVAVVDLPSLDGEEQADRIGE